MIICTCNDIYVKMLAARPKKPGRGIPPHEDHCITTAEQALDISLSARIAWERKTEETCDARLAHGPHGTCGGFSQDRT